MSNLTLDKELVKAAITELIKEDPDFIKQALKEIMIEQSNSDNILFHDLISKNFERFDRTFKSLA